MREKRGLAWLALLAPLAALPGEVAEFGALGWLGPVVALPIVAFLLWRWEQVGDLAGVLARGGKMWTLLYYIWCATTAALTAGTATDALSRTDYPQTSKVLVSLTLAAVAWYVMGKGIQGVIRWGRLIGVGVTIIIVCFLALGLLRLDWEGMRDTAGEAMSGGKAVLPVLGTASLGGLAGFLPGEPRGAGRMNRGRTGGEAGVIWATAGAWCGIAGGLCLLTFSVLGSKVTKRASLPFFLTLQGLGFEQSFQRLEAVGTAAWILAYLGMILLCGVGMERLWGKRGWNRWVLAGVVVLGGTMLSNETVRPVGPILYGINLLLGAGVPTVASFCREKKAGKG